MNFLTGIAVYFVIWWISLFVVLPWGNKPEEIVIKLRQVEVLQSQGMVLSDAIRQIGVSDVTYYRWRKEYLAWPSFN